MQIKTVDQEIQRMLNFVIAPNSAWLHLGSSCSGSNWKNEQSRYKAKQFEGGEILIFEMCFQRKKEKPSNLKHQVTWKSSKRVKNRTIWNNRALLSRFEGHWIEASTWHHGISPLLLNRRHCWTICTKRFAINWFDYSILGPNFGPPAAF